MKCFHLKRVFKKNESSGLLALEGLPTQHGLVEVEGVQTIFSCDSKTQRQFSMHVRCKRQGQQRQILICHHLSITTISFPINNIFHQYENFIRYQLFINNILLLKQILQFSLVFIVLLSLNSPKYIILSMYIILTVIIYS